MSALSLILGASHAMAAACDDPVPPGFIVARAEHQDPSEEVATALASEQAVRALEERICTETSRVQCWISSGHISAWKRPRWDPESQTACAQAAVHERWVDPARLQALQPLMESISALGEQLSRDQDGAPVYTAPPVWSEQGCGSDTLSPFVGELLQLTLQKQGVWSPDPFVEDQPLVSLRTELHRRQHEVEITFSRRGPGEPAYLPLTLPAARVPADLLGRADPSLSCVSEGSLDLAHRDRSYPPGGLELALSFPDAEAGLWCRRGGLSVSLHLSDVAWVQVLSLEGGLARLLYSSEEALSPGRHELGGLDLGPESPLQILAVASPRESPLPYEQAEGACLLSLADSLPPGPPGSSRAQVHLATLPAQSWLCRERFTARQRRGFATESQSTPAPPPPCSAR